MNERIINGLSAESAKNIVVNMFNLIGDNCKVVEFGFQLNQTSPNDEYVLGVEEYFIGYATFNIDDVGGELLTTNYDGTIQYLDLNTNSLPSLQMSDVMIIGQRFILVGSTINDRAQIIGYKIISTV